MNKTRATLNSRSRSPRRSAMREKAFRQVDAKAAMTERERRILYTTGTGVNARMKAMFTEPYLFLPKPYNVEQLTKSVTYLLAKQARD